MYVVFFLSPCVVSVCMCVCWLFVDCVRVYCFMFGDMLVVCDCCVRCGVLRYVLFCCVVLCRVVRCCVVLSCVMLSRVASLLVICVCCVCLCLRFCVIDLLVLLYCVCVVVSFGVLTRVVWSGGLLFALCFVCGIFNVC